MNERIRQLAEQADGVFIHKLITGAKQYTFLEKDLEKFAQLIVQECIVISQYDSQDDDDQFDLGRTHQAKEITYLIKEHFGVEE
jgi:hypothetical protein